MVTADARAKQALTAMYPALGPWTSAALWHGIAPPPPVPGTSLADELDVIVAQRLPTLLLRYARDAGVDLDSDLTQDLRAAAFMWTSASAQAATSGAAALQLFDRHGVRGVVSKGPGIARFYPSRTCRPYSDIDIVVAPSDFARSVALLESVGWAEDTRNLQPRTYFRRLCREGINLRLGDGSVDVHHRIPPWIFSDRLSIGWSEWQQVAVAGHELPCLAPAQNLMVAALHLVSDRNSPGKSLMVWRDVVELAGVVPVPEAVDTARAGGLSGWLRAVLLALPEQVRPVELAAALPDDAVPHAARLAQILSARAASMGVLASQFLRLPLPNGVAFVGGMTLPSQNFLEGKYPEVPHRYRRWWANGRRTTSL